MLRLNEVDSAAVGAETVYDLTFELAVKVGAVATPEALVVAVTVLCDPVNVPLGPLAAGAVNVTVTPWIGLPFESLTIAASAVANACPI